MLFRSEPLYVPATPPHAVAPRRGREKSKLETDILLRAGCGHGWLRTGRDVIRLGGGLVGRHCAHDPTQREDEDDDRENLARENQRVPVVDPAAARTDPRGFWEILRTLAARDEVLAR